MNALWHCLQTPRDTRLLSLFRISFYAGLALHFFPSLWLVHDNYGPDIVRQTLWNQTVFAAGTTLSPTLLRAAALVTMGAIAAGLFGLFPRVAAVVTLVGTYCFASLNCLPVQTLALINAWAVLPVLCVCDGAAGAWSLGRRPSLAPTGYLGSLVLFQVLLAVGFAGVEKLLWSWPSNNEMAMLFRTPQGYILRDWSWSLSWFDNPIVSGAIGWLTVGVELTTPALLLIKKTRVVGLIVYQLMFVGIVAVIEVPPLFAALFVAGGLLALDTDDLARLGLPSRP